MTVIYLSDRLLPINELIATKKAEMANLNLSPDQYADILEELMLLAYDNGKNDGYNEKESEGYSDVDRLEDENRDLKTAIDSAVADIGNVILSLPENPKAAKETLINIKDSLDAA